MMELFNSLNGLSIFWKSIITAIWCSLSILIWLPLSNSNKTKALSNERNSEENINSARSKGIVINGGNGIIKDNNIRGFDTGIEINRDSNAIIEGNKINK